MIGGERPKLSNRITDYKRKKKEKDLFYIKREREIFIFYGGKKMNDEVKEDELIKSNRKFFNYLISLRNRDLRKEIENCNWNAILQLIRYCEYEITNLKEELKGIKSNFDIQLEYDKELENYKSRCEKAIDFVKKESKKCYSNQITDNSTKVIGNFMWHTDKLLNILNGGDE